MALDPLHPWQTVVIPEGASASKPIGIPLDMIACPPGKVRRGDGAGFAEKDRPEFSLEGTEDGTGTIIKLDEPAKEAMMLQVRVKPETPEADDDEDVERKPAPRKAEPKAEGKSSESGSASGSATSRPTTHTQTQTRS